MLCISGGPRVDSNIRTKDTLDNIEETGDSVVNIVSLYLSNTMFESSKNHPPEADEFEKAGLDPLGRLAGDYTKVETIFELPTNDF